MQDVSKLQDVLALLPVLTTLMLDLSLAPPKRFVVFDGLQATHPEELETLSNTPKSGRRVAQRLQQPRSSIL